VGDVIEELSGRPVSSAADLEDIASRRIPGQPTSLMLRRAGERQTLILR
jgi:S1-C subfamily serine protease